MLYYTDSNIKLKVEKNNKLVTSNLSERHYIRDGKLIAAVTPYSLNDLTYYFLAINNISQFISIASSIKLCLLAFGDADIYPRFGKTMEWDLAAGHALLKAIGGDIFDFQARPLEYGKENFANPYFIACRSRNMINLVKF